MGCQDLNIKVEGETLSSKTFEHQTFELEDIESREPDHLATWPLLKENFTTKQYWLGWGSKGHVVPPVKNFSKGTHSTLKFTLTLCETQPHFPKKCLTLPSKFYKLQIASLGGGYFAT